MDRMGAYKGIFITPLPIMNPTEISEGLLYTTEWFMSRHRFKLSTHGAREAIIPPSNYACNVQISPHDFLNKQAKWGICIWLKELSRGVTASQPPHKNTMVNEYKGTYYNFCTIVYFGSGIQSCASLFCSDQYRDTRMKVLELSLYHI